MATQSTAAGPFFAPRSRFTKRTQCRSFHCHGCQKTVNCETNPIVLIALSRQHQNGDLRNEPYRAHRTVTARKVFDYTLSDSSLGSRAIDPADTHRTGITINPSNVSDVWIVDNCTLKVYQYTAAAGRTSGSQNAGATFALAAGNTNPQRIADPPTSVPVTAHTTSRTTASHPSGGLAARPGTTVPAHRSPKAVGWPLPLTVATPQNLGRPVTPILIPRAPAGDQDLAIVATELMRSGKKLSRPSSLGLLLH
jgi:hypothetical protein